MDNYAIIKTGGKQVRVAAGERVWVEKLESPVGGTVEIRDVLLLKTDTGTQVGRPTVPGACVTAEVTHQGRGEKIIVFKKRSKKGYKKTQGHRQYLTELLIKEIKTA